MINKEKLYELYIKNLPFFKFISDEDKNILLNNTRVRNFKKDEIVHNGLNQCSGLIFVNNGTLRAYINSDNNKEVNVYKLYKNDTCIFTASCIIKNVSFEILVKAQEDTEVFVVDSNHIENIRQKYIEVEKYISELIAQRFSDTIWSIEKILFLSLDKRIAYYLLEVADINGHNNLNITHSDIAINTGSTREVVTKMLKNFKEDGLIDTANKCITILDKQALQKLLV